jgi:hypothetical protein
MGGGDDFGNETVPSLKDCVRLSLAATMPWSMHVSHCDILP